MSGLIQQAPQPQPQPAYLFTIHIHHNCPLLAYSYSASPSQRLGGSPSPPALTPSARSLAAIPAPLLLPSLLAFAPRSPAPPTARNTLPPLHAGLPPTPLPAGKEEEAGCECIPLEDSLIEELLSLQGEECLSAVGSKGRL